ncbi:hypothetical protein CBW65_04060 [Tumebacillus avium]|uniref:Copper resistance protein D domain-containing protein n=1 Tax=Tumebacillus avium TaxID=1903704 RepID=A0A1Y0IIP2_9BACL|nr:hypothetical protein [Tumebacillus avium]ARU60327.1 hypothetical protein CBW65_04060 [Tumebacillus avium]
MIANWMLFFHLSGLAVWLGSAVLLMILFAYLKKNSLQESGLLLFCTRLVNRVSSVAAVVVLATGVGLIEALGYRGMDKPLWLNVMEQGGGVVILLFILVFLWKSRRANKQPFQAAGWYAGALGVFALAVSSVLFVVSAKLV